MHLLNKIFNKLIYNIFIFMDKLKNVQKKKNYIKLQSISTQTKRLSYKKITTFLLIKTTLYHYSIKN